MRLVSQLQDRDFAQIRGRIRRATSQVLYAEGERPCVYWDVRKNAHAKPTEHEGQPFWVEDPRGDRVLILPEQILIRAEGEKRDTLLETATADLDVVTIRIREIKEEFRESGSVDPELRAEKTRLAKIATLLCAIRAHARGNLHASANLHEQQRFIDAQMHLIQTGELGSATMKTLVQQLEIVLAPDDPVEVEGIFRIKPVPANLVGAQGYRERPTCWTLCGGEAQPAILVGRGHLALPAKKVEVEEGVSPGAALEKPIHPPPHRDPIVQGTTAVTVLAVILSYLLFF